MREREYKLIMLERRERAASYERAGDKRVPSLSLSLSLSLLLLSFAFALAFSNRKRERERGNQTHRSLHLHCCINSTQRSPIASAFRLTEATAATTLARSLTSLLCRPAKNACSCATRFRFCSRALLFAQPPGYIV